MLNFSFSFKTSTMFPKLWTTINAEFFSGFIQLKSEFQVSSDKSTASTSHPILS